MKRKPWTEEDKRAFHDQNLRANTIPGRRDSGPLPQEWEWEPDTDGSPEGDEPTP